MTTFLDPSIWPPIYQITRHKRAKHVKFRASRTKGLQITVPPRFNLKQLPEILEIHRPWIVKQLSQLQAKADTALPTQLVFHATNTTYPIFYVPTEKKISVLERPNKEIVLIGNVADKTSCQRKLLAWVKKYAKPYLLHQLKLTSELLQLPYHASNVKNQNTLWGSCTVNKSINLNYKLIFLPPHLVNHILIHELCHTQYLNHSPRFWNLVASFDPQWQEHRRQMRQADQFVPGWVTN